MPLERFAGKVALMTGATQGIGFETARRVGQEGGKVVISSRREENVKNAVSQLRSEGLEVSGIPCHQGKKDDRKKLIQFAFERYGGFDCVFINAALSVHSGNLLTVTPDVFQKTFDINVKQTFLFIQECVPLLEKRGSGSIVTTSTAGANDSGMRFIGMDILLYMWTKFTLNGMCYNLSRDCFNKNVRLNTVLPGMIETRFLSGGVDSNLRRHHLSLMGLKETDLGARIGKPNEVGALVAFLLSDDASYVTGESIICAGPQASSRFT